jgi:hypothetical protein
MSEPSTVIFAIAITMVFVLAWSTHQRSRCSPRRGPTGDERHEHGESTGTGPSKPS